MKRLVDWLIAWAMKTPYWHLEGYMNRYWILPFRFDRAERRKVDTGCYSIRPWRNPAGWLLQRLGVAIRVHHILRSDDDRAFHDHPWSYLTIILRGGYVEVRPVFDKSGLYMGDSRKWYGPGSVLWRPAKSWHRLEVPAGQTAWTLFITGPYRQKWGFLVQPRAKVPYHEYQKEQTNG